MSSHPPAPFENFFRRATGRPPHARQSRLATCHHGKARLSIRSIPDERVPTTDGVHPEERRFARGVRDDDELPACDPSGRVSMLRKTRRLYELYPQIRQPAIGESGELAAPASDHQPTPLPPAGVLAFSWTRLIEFIRLDDPWKRALYEKATTGLDRQPFVSRYLATLPSVEALQDLIERGTATWLRVREEAGEYLAGKSTCAPSPV